MSKKSVKNSIFYLLILLIICFTSCIAKTGSTHTQTDINSLNIRVAITSFYVQTNKLPVQLEELIPIYIRNEKYFIDQWDNKFQYEIIRKENKFGYKLFSYGADNKKGGFGKNKDIIIEYFFEQ